MTIGIKVIFMGYRPPARIVTGAVLGVLGIAVVFAPKMGGISALSGSGIGLLLSVAGTMSFSLGSIVSARNQLLGLTGPACIAWAMTYGTILLTVYALIGGNAFTFDPAPAYIGSLLYLSLVGSVLGFVCYFALIRRIQADRAAYATVLFPVVALSLSTLFEGYQWSATAFCGVVLTLIGNVLVLSNPGRSRIRDDTARLEMKSKNE
jgi:drug/metabolite transporter (DMT)-like permease